MISGNSMQVVREHQAAIRVVVMAIGLSLLLVLAFSLLNSLARADGSPSKAATASLNLQSSQITTNSATPPSPTSGSLPTASSSSTTTVNSSTSTSSDGTVSTQLEVNGQPVSVPSNGSTEQTVTSPDGSTTTVNASNTQSGSGTAHSSSQTHVFTSIHSTSQVVQQGGSSTN